jgi:hypothetical protein
MATTTSEIMDLFLSAVSDYKLDAIYTASGSLTLNTYCEPWLLKAIQSFPNCTQSLAYTVISGSSDGQFTEALTSENQIILSQFMELRWLEKGLQDIRALNNFVQDRDFKSFSPSQNIKARTDNYNSKKEELSQRLVDYAVAHNVSWSNWKNGVFDT